MLGDGADGVEGLTGAGRAMENHVIVILSGIGDERAEFREGETPFRGVDIELPHDVHQLILVIHEFLQLLALPIGDFGIVETKVCDLEHLHWF